MAFYLGIDGGGTKTRCILADETTAIAKAMTGGNIVRLGERQAKEALQSAIGQVCSAGKISPSQIRAVCIGVAGAARPEIAAKVRSILDDVIPQNAGARIEITGDNDIALEAAFGTGMGVIVVSGTGSIAYGRNATGQTARAGGWGFAVSDEGSGHWIGRKAISTILNAQDQGMATALTSMVLQIWKLNSIDGLVQQANAFPQPDFPRLFPVVLRAAEDGDSWARGLLSKAGIALATLAETVLHRLTPDPSSEKLPVGPPTGSVFRPTSRRASGFLQYPADVHSRSRDQAGCD